MAKANCTQESEVFTLSYVFHELVVLAEAQRFVIKNMPDTDAVCVGINCTLTTFQRRLDELVFELDKIVYTGGRNHD